MATTVIALCISARPELAQEPACPVAFFGSALTGIVKVKNLTDNHHDRRFAVAWFDPGCRVPVASRFKFGADVGVDAVQRQPHRRWCGFCSDCTGWSPWLSITYDGDDGSATIGG